MARLSGIKRRLLDPGSPGPGPSLILSSPSRFGATRQIDPQA